MIVSRFDFELFCKRGKVAWIYAPSHGMRLLSSPLSQQPGPAQPVLCIFYNATSAHPPIHPMQVLSVPRNPDVFVLPVAASAVAHSLHRLSYDIGMVAGSGTQLRQLHALEELEVLLPTQHFPPPDERDVVLQQQQPALAALRGPPRLHLVGLEGQLAALLGGSQGGKLLEPLVRLAVKVTLEAWTQQLPGKRVVEMTAALGPTRPLPNFDRPEWETVNIE